MDTTIESLLTGSKDPVEPFAMDQREALLLNLSNQVGPAEMLEGGRFVRLACGHFVRTKKTHRAACHRCGTMIRSGYDYDGFRHLGVPDRLEWDADPLRSLHESQR